MTTVVFDLGETLFDETELWGSLADELGVPRLTFFAALGALVARGQSHRRMFELFGSPAREDGANFFGRESLYPDALPCLDRLRDAGYRVGVAANVSATARTAVDCLGELCVVGGAGEWGVEKPAPAFFERLIREVHAPPEEIAYVGDRVDNDVAPALAAGMTAVHVRRGPWGYLQEPPPQAIAIRGLDELPRALERRG